MKILAISLPGLGNTLLLTPALRLLKQKIPGVSITVLVMFQSSKDLLGSNPSVDEVLHWDFIEKSRLSSLRFVMGLRQRRFDVSLLGYPSNRFEYNLIQWLIGSPKRLGHHYRHFDWQNLNFLNTLTVVESDLLHDVEENVRLIRQLGVETDTLPKPEIFLTSSDHDFAKRWLEERKLTEPLLIGFHAGSAIFKNHVRRRWDPEKFAQLGDRLTSRVGCSILLFGGKEDETANASIFSSMKTKPFLVQGAGITQTASLMAHCKIMVTNDSSLMHLAAALEIPIVAIFGPTDPRWVRPFQSPHRIVRKDLSCSPCFYYSPKPLTCYRPEKDFACLKWIEPEEVLEAVDSFLKNPSSFEGASHV